MGHENRGNPRLSLYPTDLLPGLQPQSGIQIGERLIQQKHPGPLYQRSRYCHPLLLSAGEFTGLTIHQLADLHQPCRFPCLLQHLGLGQPVLSLQILQRKDDILPHCQMGIKRIVLKHQTDPPVLRRQVCNIIAAEKNPAAAGLDQSADQIQRSAFPAAGRPQQTDQLPIRNLKSKIIHRNNIPTILPVPARKFLRQVL